MIFVELLVYSVVHSIEARLNVKNFSFLPTEREIVLAMRKFITGKQNKNFLVTSYHF